MPVHCRHGVKSQELQAHRTQMNALHRPVVHSASAKGAPVTAAVAENPPSVAKIVAVLPHGAQNIFVGIGVLLIQPVRYKADPVAIRSAAVSRHTFLLTERLPGCEARRGLKD